MPYIKHWYASRFCKRVNGGRLPSQEKLVIAELWKPDWGKLQAAERGNIKLRYTLTET